MFDAQDPRITAYVLDELDAAEREQFEQELSASPELQVAVEQLRGTADLLSGALAGEPALELSAEQQHKISQLATQAEQPVDDSASEHPTQAAAESARPLAMLATVAAMLLLAAGLAYVISGQFQSSPSEVAQRPLHAGPHADDLILNTLTPAEQPTHVSPPGKRAPVIFQPGLDDRLSVDESLDLDQLTPPGAPGRADTQTPTPGGTFQDASAWRGESSFDDPAKYDSSGLLGRTMAGSRGGYEGSFNGKNLDHELTVTTQTGTVDLNGTPFNDEIVTYHHAGGDLGDSFFGNEPADTLSGLNFERAQQVTVGPDDITRMFNYADTLSYEEKVEFYRSLGGPVLSAGSPSFGNHLFSQQIGGVPSPSHGVSLDLAGNGVTSGQRDDNSFFESGDSGLTVSGIDSVRRLNSRDLFQGGAKLTPIFPTSSEPITVLNGTVALNPSQQPPANDSGPSVTISTDLSSGPPTADLDIQFAQNLPADLPATTTPSSLPAPANDPFARDPGKLSGVPGETPPPTIRVADRTPAKPGDSSGQGGGGQGQQQGDGEGQSQPVGEGKPVESLTEGTTTLDRLTQLAAGRPAEGDEEGERKGASQSGSESGEKATTGKDGKELARYREVVTATEEAEKLGRQTLTKVARVQDRLKQLEEDKKADPQELRRANLELQQAQDQSEKLSKLQIALGNEAKKLKQELDQRGTRTWSRATAVPNASRLSVGENDDLAMEGMQVNVRIDGFRARVLLDCYFYNDRDRQLEGSYKLRLPNEASLFYFAFGETRYEYRPMVDHLASKGFLSADLVRAAGMEPGEILDARKDSFQSVKVARLVPREKAAHAYSETVRRRVDPALVEWSGAGVFQARVFPLMPRKLHRIVVGYDVNLEEADGDLWYRLPLPEDLNECVVDLDVAALPGVSAQVAPAAAPFLANGRAFYHIKDARGQQIAVHLQETGTTALIGETPNSGKFFATRLTPELPAGKDQAGAKQAIFLLDTSLSANPDKFNVWLQLLEATLDKNRDSLKQFAVLQFNIEQHWWRDGYTANTPENVAALLADCRQLALEGATDLNAAVLEANSPAWADENERLPARPDLFLLSDGAATWGETAAEQIAAALQTGTRGTLFAYRTGLEGTASDLLQTLARTTGGSVFSVVSEAEIAAAATAHRHRPWELVSTTVTGGSDLLTAGRIRSIYPGQSLLLVGRGDVNQASEVVLELRRGDQQKTIRAPMDRVVESDLAPRLYGQVAVGQLEELDTEVDDVAVAYARHFRVTGRVCSLLMLDNEADYQRFNIRPEDDAFVVKSSPASSLVADEVEAHRTEQANPREALQAWLGKLEKTAGVEYRLPTPLKLAIDRMPADAFQLNMPRLAVKQRAAADQPRQYAVALAAEQLDYDTIMNEAARRLDKQGSTDALLVASNLIERNPGEMVIARDVAYSALEWNLPGAAYPLLKRVADARPFEPQVYQALGQCLAELGKTDLALVYYEVALEGKWNNRYHDFGHIVSVEYLHLLREIQTGRLHSSVPEYAAARLESLNDKLKLGEADLVVSMMWSTDRTDVDLHVREPSGEECFFKNRSTKAGGQITVDVTEGYGPEMYTMKNAEKGQYVIKANYFGSDANRTSARTKVYVTVYEDFGREFETVTRKTVTLGRSKEMRELMTVTVKK